MISIPFDYNPRTTTVKTTTYNVPANRYARVTPLCGDFSIDGVYLGYSTSFSFLVNNQTITPSLSIPSQGYSVIYISSSGSSSTGSAQYIITGESTVVFNRNSYSAVLERYLLNTGVTIDFNLSETGSFSFTTACSVYFLPAVEPIWVKGGTTLGGIRYLVEEFNQIA